MQTHMHAHNKNESLKKTHSTVASITALLCAVTGTADSFPQNRKPAGD